MHKMRNWFRRFNLGGRKDNDFFSSFSWWFIAVKHGSHILQFVQGYPWFLLRKIYDDKKETNFPKKHKEAYCIEEYTHMEPTWYLQFLPILVFYSFKSPSHF